MFVCKSLCDDMMNLQIFASKTPLQRLSDAMLTVEDSFVGSITPQNLTLYVFATCSPSKNSTTRPIDLVPFGSFS